MNSLSYKEYESIKSLYESVYDSSRFETVIDEFTDEDLLDNFSEEYIEENVEQLFIECMTEGMTIDEVEAILTESIESSIRLLNEDYYDSAVKASKEASKKPEVRKANRREALKKVGSAVKKVASGLKKGAKVAGKAAQGGVGLTARAVGTAQRASDRIKSAAKSGYERGRYGAGGSSSSSSSSSGSSSSGGGSSSSSSGGGSSSSGGGSSSYAPSRKKRKDGLLKRGLKKLVRGVSKSVSAAAGAVKAGADSITDRARKEELEATGLFSEKEIEAIMEAEVQEVYKGKHGQSDKEYADSRSQGGKMVSGDSKQSGAEYTHGRRVKAANPGMQPDVGGKTKPKSQGKMDRGTRADLEYRKANLKKEELEATGLFTVKEIEAIMEAEMSEGYKEIDAKKHGRMYDRYKKLRSAAMQDARDSGEASGTNRMKMGKMSAVIDKSSENLRKKQTRDQLTGRG